MAATSSALEDWGKSAANDSACKAQLDDHCGMHAAEPPHARSGCAARGGNASQALELPKFSRHGSNLGPLQIWSETIHISSNPPNGCLQDADRRGCLQDADNEDHLWPARSSSARVWPPKRAFNARNRRNCRCSVARPDFLDGVGTSIIGFAAEVGAGNLECRPNPRHERPLGHNSS